MKKKILIFSLAYYPETVGGAEIAIKEITDRIDPKQIEFHMVTLRFNSQLAKEEVIGNITVHRIGLTKKNPSSEDLKKFPLHLNKLYYQFAATKQAIKLHKKYKFDALWAMMAHSCGVPTALFNIFCPRIPYVLTLQEGDPIDYIEKKMKPLWPLFTRAFTKASIIQAISKFLADWATKRGFNGPIEIIHNGGNARDFAANFSQDELEKLKQTLGKKPGDIFLVTTSRLVHKNAIDDVIRALTMLPENIYFIIVGGGPDEAKLKKLARDLKVEQRTKFIGQVENTETPKYRRISDIYIRPSRSEGMGNAFISAMAARLPIVTTQEGGIADFLFDEKRNPDKPTTGWAVDKDNPEQIAEAIKDILAHPEKVKKATDNAYQLAYEKYNWDSIADDMVNKIFNKLFELTIDK